ncbi:acyl carrier protein [Lactobacillus psittaci]|nr:acyl carrier protein [Lactobacillus psittaci]
MTQTEIFNKIASILADHFNIDQDKVTMDLNFKNDLDADSIDFVEFVMDLEDEFGSEIPDDEAEKLTTVGQAVEYIEKHQ